MKHDILVSFLDADMSDTLAFIYFEKWRVRIDGISTIAFIYEDSMSRTHIKFDNPLIIKHPDYKNIRHQLIDKITES